MNSLILIVFSCLVFLWGYRIYGKRLELIFGIDPSHSTPSKTKYDGVDYVPAKSWLVLFGHHFSSIAGAGPIVGPIIAVCIWGWAPALLWVLIGSVFLGAVHDFGALAASVKEGGSTISSIAARTISKRASILFGVFVWFALILVIAVFVYLCADTFVKEASVVVPSVGFIPVAVLTGFMLYRLKLNQVLATSIGLVLVVGLIILGRFVSVSLTFNQWAIVLLVYSFFASILPVNLLLQPRDYLSSFLLFFGMAVGFLGLFITHPNMELPAFKSFNPEQGMLWPMLFITIACGAISGFHSVVSSGTTAKQIANERHIKRVGYGSMLVEGLLAVMVILIIGSGASKQCSIFDSSPIAIFGKGFGVVTRPILRGFGGAIAIIILNAFILTTLDTATRITRYITEELFRIKNRFISTSLILGLGGWLALAKDNLDNPMWKKLWPAFGASNQLVAALALFVISCWLLYKNKPNKFALYPAIFMLVTTIGALAFQIVSYFKSADYLLLIISLILIVLALVMVWDVVIVSRRKRIV